MRKLFLLPALLLCLGATPAISLSNAPYLAPVPKRGKTNEPAFVAHTAAKVAELKGVSLVELEAATTDNFFRLFAKAERAKCG